MNHIYSYLISIVYHHHLEAKRMVGYWRDYLYNLISLKLKRQVCTSIGPRVGLPLLLLGKILRTLMCHIQYVYRYTEKKIRIITKSSVVVKKRKKTIINLQYVHFKSPKFIFTTNPVCQIPSTSIINCYESHYLLNFSKK